MKVKAISLGYHNNRRQKEGTVFEMAEDVYHPIDPKTKKPALHPDGSPKICRWVEPVEGFEVDQESGKVVAKTTKKAKAKEE